MRDLELNKTTVWVLSRFDGIDVVDSDGFLTGEKTHTYMPPRKIRLNLNPYAGRITTQLFGTDASLDLYATSHNIELNEHDLLFLTEPLDNYDTKYDYVLTSKKKSLNIFSYGLKRRI